MAGSSGAMAGTGQERSMLDSWSDGPRPAAAAAACSPAWLHHVSPGAYKCCSEHGQEALGDSSRAPLIQCPLTWDTDRQVSG